MEDGRRTLGDTHPNTLTSINDLARLFETQGKLDDAEPLFREAASGARKTLGDAHPTTVIIRKNLGRGFQKWGKPREAAAVLFYFSFLSFLSPFVHRQHPKKMSR